MLDVVAVDPVSALLHRFAVHRTEALGFDQSHRVVKFCGVVAVERRGTAAVDEAVRDDTIDQLLVVGANVALVDALAEEPFARAESAADCTDTDFFDVLYHRRVECIVGGPSVVAQDARGSDNVVAKCIDPKSA